MKRRAIFVFLAFVAALVGCTSTSSTSIPKDQIAAAKRREMHRMSLIPSGSRVWMMEGPYIESWDMATNDGGVASDNVSYFAGGNHVVLYPAFVNQTPAASPPPSWTVVTWVKFASVACFKWTLSGDHGANPGSCASGSMPTGAAIVGYDNEDWSATPCDEWEATPCPPSSAPSPSARA
jgi:hypothetical protein